VVNVEDLALQVRASIGAALCPRDATAPQRLLQRAEMSMHAAKSAHRGVEFFRHEHDRSSPRRLTVIGELRRTLDGRGMSLEFQPQVSLSSGTVVAVESLARWDHLSLGSIRPDEFIPLAEHTGMIRALTQNVVEHTLRQALTWSDAGIELRYSINLSARSLLDVDLIDQVEMMLARSHLHPSCFSFEVTESSIMADPVGALAVLRKLASYGVRLSIDDYGTGHSSLAYLRRLPASEVKIGKEFIVDIVTDPRASAIVKSTIDLGHDLGLEIVAEGVEDEATLRLLKKLGCDLAQGYHVGRPQPAEQFERWLWTNGAWRPRQREDAHNGEPVAEERQGSVISIDKIRRRPG
jgi:EAL domain-containing protein (putative c-di-GMP-specific phosphodiesterase class I)